MRVAFCFILGAAIAIILWLPPSRLHEKLGRFDESTLPIREDKHAFEALAAQQTQVREEILERIRFENQWYQYKFLVLGGLFVGSFGLAAKVKSRFDSFEHFLKSREFMLILGVAVMVALMIDIHVRLNILVMNQLGTWLAKYYEPAMFGPLAKPNDPAAFQGWEGFLRIEAPGITGMHQSSLYSLTFWPAIHLTTLLPLTAYCVSFAYRRVHYKHEEQSIDLFIYLAFVAVLSLFATMSRAIPETFQIRLLPFISVWSPPLVGSAIAAAASLLFLFVPLVFRPKRVYRA